MQKNLTFSTIFENVQLGSASLEYWKLNLLAILHSENEILFFAAEGCDIRVYKYPHFSKPIRTLTRPNRDFPINQIRLEKVHVAKYSKEIPILISVDDGGYVILYIATDLDKKPIVLQNGTESTWGVAIDKNAKIVTDSLGKEVITIRVAVSANNYCITLWENISLEENGSINSKKTQIQAHSHNIPSIDFSPKSGYLSSISIDTHAKVWDLRKASSRKRRKVESNSNNNSKEETKEEEEVEILNWNHFANVQLSTQWGWGSRWIDRSSIISIDSIPTSTWKKLVESIKYFFSDSLNLDLLSRNQNNTTHFLRFRVGEDNINYTEEAEAEQLQPPESEPESEGEGEEAISDDGSEENQIKDGKKEEEHIKENSNEIYEEEDPLLLLTTFFNLYLSDKTLEIKAQLKNALLSPLMSVPGWMRSMRRIALLEYIPELSLCIMGSQGCASVLVVQIFQNAETQGYEMVPLAMFPLNPIPHLLYGIAVTKEISKNPFLSYCRVHVLFQNRTFSCYQIDFRTFNANTGFLKFPTEETPDIDLNSLDLASIVL